MLVQHVTLVVTNVEDPVILTVWNVIKDSFWLITNVLQHAQLVVSPINKLVPVL